MGLRHSGVVEAPVDEVFAWHERPGALARLAPPWQPIRVLEEASSLRDGKAVLRLPGGVRWVAQHGGYEPPRQFVDELVSLPLRWRHTHTFEPVTTTTTRVTDVVETPVPGSVLVQTFRFRHRQLAADLAAQRAMTALRPRPLTVAVTGSSGLIGSALCAFLTTGGHRVIRLVRRPPRGGRAPLATGAARPAGARGCRRRRAPGRSVDRGPVQRSPQTAGPRQPDRTDERAGHDHGDHGRDRRRLSRPRECVRHRLLRRRWRGRAAHRGERPRRRVPGRGGGRLGGRDASRPARPVCVW